MAVSTLKKGLKPYSATLTSGTSGNIRLVDIFPTGAIPVVAECQTPYMGVPFRVNGVWYLKCFAFNKANEFQTATEATISFTVWCME